MIAFYSMTYSSKVNIPLLLTVHLTGIVHQNEKLKADSCPSQSNRFVCFAGLAPSFSPLLQQYLLQTNHWADVQRKTEWNLIFAQFYTTINECFF